MQWLTAGAFEAGAFEKWADDLAQAFVRLEPSAVRHEPRFRGEINKVSAGQIQISRVRASGHRVKRLAQHIAASNADICFVNLQVNGRGMTRQCGREVLTAPFDLAVVDTTREFEIIHHADFELFSFAVPAAMLPPVLLDRGGVALSRSPVRRELAQALLSYASLALASPERPLLSLELVGNHVAGLLACFSEAFEGDTEPAVRSSARLTALINYLQRHLDEDDLGAERLAQAFGISVRYVHKLFASTGQSVSGFICTCRIDQARALLSDPSSARIAITDLAFKLGFRDLSYFNRRFKASAGMTPSDFRRQSLERVKS